VKIGYAYNEDGLITKLIVPSFINLKHEEIISIITRLLPHSIHTIDKANLANPLIGRVSSIEESHVERWEYLSDIANRRAMFFNRYTGISFPFSPCWKSDCGRPPETWQLPRIILMPPKTNPDETLDANSPWGNVVDMTNSKDGVSLDEIYIQPRITFKPPVMMQISAKFPDPATLGANDTMLAGFEVNSQGGHAIHCIVVNSGPFLDNLMMTPSGREDNGTAFTVLNPNVFSRYFLEFDPPFLRLWQSPAGHPETFPNQLTTSKCLLGNNFDNVNAFIANEAVSIKSFYVNHWAVWSRTRLSNSVLPQAYGKTPIIKSNSASNNSAIIHTVTAGKIFYLTGGQLEILNTAASNQQDGYLEVDTGGDGVFRKLLFMSLSNSALIDRSSKVCPLTVNVPLPFPAGTVFRVTSLSANISLYGTIIGWEDS